jgi:hypothetical protein
MSEGLPRPGGTNTPGMAEADLAELTRARSMLMILLATAKETLLALEAVSNVLDTDLTDDLRAMISRSERQLEALGQKTGAGRG